MQNHPVEEKTIRKPVVLIWRCLGLLFVAIGCAGVVLPVLPTTPFMLLALWAFAKGSPALHAWLITHPNFGPPLQDWTRYGVIPRQAKTVAISVMLISLGVTIYSGAAGPVVLGLVIALMLAGAGFILSRPSDRPTE